LPSKKVGQPRQERIDPPEEKKLFTRGGGGKGNKKNTGWEKKIREHNGTKEKGQKRKDLGL